MRPLTPEQKEFGYFADPESGDPLDRETPIVSCDWCRDGTRDVIVTRPILYVDPYGDEWTVEPGFRTNGQSTPFVLWPIMQPYQGLCRDAAVAHDMACEARGVTWAKAAWVFYYALRAAGVGGFRAWIRWLAVRYVGAILHWRR